MHSSLYMVISSGSRARIHNTPITSPIRYRYSFKRYKGSPNSLHLTRGLAARRLFKVPPCPEQLQTSMSSPGFEPRPNGSAVSVANHYTGWVTKVRCYFLLYSPKNWEFRTICQLDICDDHRPRADLLPYIIITHSINKRQSVELIYYAPEWGASLSLRNTGLHTLKILMRGDINSSEGQIPSDISAS
ncbi:hypothetical protein TNCV_3354861 [Trichonephila clavipes]|nr:hypothetical protein TNCV_3354861 [Trichonephila clavipes]